MENSNSGTRLAIRSRTAAAPLLEPQVTRIKSVLLNCNERLADEPLFHFEGTQGGAAAGGVAVEREDELARQPVRVHEQPAQDLYVAVAERLCR